MQFAKDVAFLVSSGGAGSYSRYEAVRRVRANWILDVIFIDIIGKVTFGTNCAVLGDGKAEYNLEDYRAIVYWPSSFQYAPFRLAGKLEVAQFREYAERSWRVMERAMFERVADRMINCYSSSQRAANKACIFDALRNSATPFPPTIFTSDASSARKFGLEGSILKTVADTHDIDEKHLAFPTRLSDSHAEEMTDDVPFIIQREVSASEEYRSYVFGEECFVFKIARDDVHEVDVRMRQGEYLPCAIVNNAEVCDAAISIAQKFNLGMCSIDFIYSKDGQLFTLDVNPHGSWHWLPPEFQSTLDESFVRLLDTRVSR